MFPPSPQFGGHNSAGLWNFWSEDDPEIMSKAAVRTKHFHALNLQKQSVPRVLSTRNVRGMDRAKRLLPRRGDYLYGCRNVNQRM